jgi:hypothetical protein
MFENERHPAPGPGCWRLDLPLVPYAVWLDNVLAIEALSGILGVQRALTVGLEAARQREAVQKTLPVPAFPHALILRIEPKPPLSSQRQNGAVARLLLCVRAAETGSPCRQDWQNDVSRDTCGSGPARSCV